jgi:hypothetical protein
LFTAEVQGVEKKGGESDHTCSQETGIPKVCSVSAHSGHARTPQLGVIAAHGKEAQRAGTLATEATPFRCVSTYRFQQQRMMKVEAVASLIDVGVERRSSTKVKRLIFACGC